MGEPVLWGGILLGAFCVLLLFRKAAKQLVLLALRTGLGGIFLALIAPLGSAMGVSLGVNLFNALVLGVLGLPGLGLLLLLRWSCL
ncbi:MAG: pro-sigmaK processing inhibitor BofA family protein [Candidatus Onthomonas sp.]|nr:pro-sigmaK processing inhibitor BofA family protein [Candidatus Onthomonas sp.]